MSSSKYDLNRFKKIYPLVRVKPVFQDFTVVDGLDAETVILDYVNTHAQTYFFIKNYVTIPTISATPEDENVNVYITSLTTNSVTIESSSSFTGSVHVQILKDTSQNV
tara:strand:- start:3162 stop:3485 length:324 start_codon:yes stop_codon:yes gene_type:complete